MKAALTYEKGLAARPRGRGRHLLRTALAAAAASLVLAGCASNADFLASQRDIAPTQWAADLPQLAGASAEENRHWWQAWNNPELNTLLEAAARANTDVLTAMANLRRAAALADEATANLFPTLNASAGGNSTRRDSVTTESWNAEAAASWSFSLAGGNIAARRAANL